MPKIVRVDALDGDTIDIQLENSNIILLNLRPLKNDPVFTALWEDDRILYPKTDGDSVFWHGGPKLTLEEVFCHLGASEKKP